MDLRKLGWRWTWSDDHEKGHAFDPYHVRLIAKYGTVHLAGTETLGTWVTSIRKLNELAMAGYSVVARGDDEGIVRFPASELPNVAKVIRLRKRRVGRSTFQPLSVPVDEGETDGQGTIALPSVPDVVQTSDRAF